MPNQMLDLLRSRLTQRVDEFPGVAGFSVRDLTTGDQISFLGDDLFPSASTIKIYVLVTLLCQAESAKGPDPLQQRVPVDVRVPGSGVLSYLEHPVELSLLDLAILMMIVSDNTATNICIVRAGMDKVNATIADFGLSNTILRRVMQDNEAIAAGRENITTPNDLVSTFASLYAGKPTETTARRALEVMSKPYASPFRAAIPGSIRVAHKTGGMPRVRSEAALIDLPGRPYAFSVMSKYAMNDLAEQATFLSDMARTTHQVFATLADSNPFGQGLTG
jgi:beta-lactamase class A